MGSDLPKTLCEVAGKPMLAHILEALGKAGNCLPPIIVIGHKGEQVRAFGGSNFTYVEQADLSGTGTATKVAMPYVPKDASKVFIMYGDHPFITAEHIKAIEEKHDASGSTVTIATATLPDFSDWRSVFVSFGRVVRNNKGEVQEIKEYKNANEVEQNIREVNPGFYCADAAWLSNALSEVARDSVTGEYYLTDIVSLALYEGKKVETISIDPKEALGINSPQDASQAEALIVS